MVNTEKARRMFPDITDWGNPQNDRRNNKDYKGMSLKEFFWFSPACYKMIYLGSDIINIFIFGVIGISSRKWLGTGWSIIPFIISFLFIIAFIRKMLKYNTFKNVNMFDLHLRDYTRKVKGRNE